MKLPVEVQMVAVRSRRLILVLWLAIGAGLAGCGNKGPLVLPEPEQKPASAGSSGAPSAG
jgi:predicted small lipoprotein YifL